MCQKFTFAAGSERACFKRISTVSDDMLLSREGGREGGSGDGNEKKERKGVEDIFDGPSNTNSDHIGVKSGGDLHRPFGAPLTAYK